MNGYYDYSNGVFFDAEHLRQLRRKFSQLAFAFILYTFIAYLSIFIIQFLVTLLGIAPALDKNIFWQWSISLLPLYIFGFPCSYFFLKKMPVVRPKVRTFSFADFLLLFLIGRFFTLLGSSISGFLVGFTEMLFGNTIQDQTSELISNTPTYLIIIGAVIVGPIVEELVYRKLIIDRIYEHGETVAILFSSLIFSLAHGNLFQVVYAFLNGCILGFIYVRSGRLRYSILFHMLTNFLGSVVVVPIIKAQAQLEALSEMGSITGEYISLSLLVSGYGYAKFFLAALGCAVFLFLYKKFLPDKKAIAPLPKGRAFNITLATPGFFAFLFIALIEFLLSAL